MFKKSKRFKRAFWLFVSLLLLMNGMAFFHAYQFTHFSAHTLLKTQRPEALSWGDKIKTLFFGIQNPRPNNTTVPQQPYETIYLQSNKKIETWYVPALHTDSVKGSIILLHGYGGNKASMLDKSDFFHAHNYNVLLVDFMGCGGSEGNQTSIGFKEAEEVKTCFDYLVKKGEKNIYLFGTSMGAVAILKAIADYQLQPKAILLECPFGSMQQTVEARFRNMHAPAFPMAHLLVFWGGVQNGFWAFGHNPSTYAKQVHCPTLLMFGEQDKNVSRAETDAIYSNLKGPKNLQLFAHAGHENYLETEDKNQWKNSVLAFLKSH